MRLFCWVIVALASACGEAPRCPLGMREADGRCVCEDGRYLDGDGDGFGAGAPLPSCRLAAGIVTRGGDCEDGDRLRHPGAPEVCNGVDDDCDGDVDEAFECALGERVACVTGCGTEGARVCTASCDLPDEAECEPPPEVCNGVDDDCDGNVDEGPRALTWRGVIEPGPVLEAHVAGFEGGLIVFARTPSGGLVKVLDPSGDALRSDRGLDARLGSVRFARRAGGQLLLRGRFDGPPPRPLCAELGAAPDYALEPVLCEGTLDPDFELWDVRADGPYEVWIGGVGGEAHAGVVGLGPVSLSPLRYYEAPIAARRVLSITRLERLLAAVNGYLHVLVTEGGAPDGYVLATTLGRATAEDVHVAEELTTLAQARADSLLVRRYGPKFECDGLEASARECVHAEVPAEVAAVGERAVSVVRAERRTFVGYVAEEGTALGYLELAEDDTISSHVTFGHAEGPFAEVHLADAGEPTPQIAARTVAGALHLYVPSCADE